MSLATYRFLALILLCAFGVGGVLQTFTQYPFQVPDERTHWLAGVSRVNALLPGRQAKCDSLMGLAEQFDFGRIVFNGHEKGTPGKFAASQTAASECIDPKMNYGFILSYPGVVAAMICRELLPLSDVSVFFLARLFQGLMLVAMLAALAHLVLADSGNFFWRRFFFLVLLFLMLTPVGEQQSFAVSADPLVNAFALFVVYLMWAPRVTRGVVALYFVFGLAASITKPPLLAWLVPIGWWLRVNGKFRSPVEASFWVCTGVIIAATAALSVVSVSIAVPLDRAVPSEQLAFLKSHPFQGLAIFTQGAWQKLVRPGLLSNSLGWLDFGVTPGTLRIQKALHFLVVLAFWLPVAWAWRSLRVHSKALGRWTLAADLFLAFGFWVSVMGICFFLYLYWNVPAAPILDGLQMRYFLCFLLVGVGWLGNRLDTHWPLTFKAPKLAPALVLPVMALAAGSVLAYLVERSFSNLVRYF
jgi:hypothetical protein